MTEIYKILWLEDEILKITKFSSVEDAKWMLDDILDWANKINNEELIRQVFTQVQSICESKKELFRIESHRRQITKWLQNDPFIINGLNIDFDKMWGVENTYKGPKWNEL